MTLAPDLKLAELALDALEALEARCLVWGLVDNALSRDEVTTTLQGLLESPKAQPFKSDPRCSIQTARDLREFLVARKMLFEVPFVAAHEPRWRTRMAEGVRLLAQLRQLFSKHENNKWSEAATLVADFRLMRRPRRYPRRDLSATHVFDSLCESIRTPKLLEAVKTWLDFLESGGGLAQFQVKSAQRILAGLENRTCSGTLVSAGTGSGKTLAFYLPALSWLAAQRVQAPQNMGVRVLALYPRNELLKDQLSEVYAQCRKFDRWITRQGGRPLRVGVLYGETPNNAAAVLNNRIWSDHSQGKSVPFFNCPQDNKHGELVWLRDDASQKQERLVCPHCHAVVDTHTLAFTRDNIKADPPDILFTSVEMLNRHLPSSDLRHVFGVGRGANRAPDLILLDEVHLYAGTYGAQVAYLLRRWWAASGRRSSFVGLSATIADGQKFFAHLTGLSEGVVEEIKPLEDEIVEEGAEYMLALRGDPVSQTALLSTTIQTLMLSSRLLDPPGAFDRKTNPFFGWRAFAFTDQLDATNRLFKDLLDAEGRYPSGGGVNLNRYPDGGLARLRRGTTPIIGSPRFYAGQDWSIPEFIGHDLTYRLGVGRTTALDSGVSSKTEVVVATSSLEVGFDDPAVGVVVQHKAPRDIASFLQRKGRAGRTRHMRPWTIVVLTDYGRDRLAYQAYDQLFDPDLPARQLPMANRYVQRMQAVYALLDILGDWTSRDHPPLSVWRDLSHPNIEGVPNGWSSSEFGSVKGLAKNLQLPLTAPNWIALKTEARNLAPKRNAIANKYAGENWLTKRLQHQRVVNLLVEVLENPDKSIRLARDLADRLALESDDLNVLMWSQPRPLMLGAIPTAIRRLASGWRARGRPGEDHQAGHPLPDYIPAKLFDDLSLPEMRIDPAERQRELEDQYMPVQQGLGEFAPGKVSRRYDDALWLGVDGQALGRYFASGTTDVPEEAELSEWFTLDARRNFVASIDGTQKTFKAYRPQTAHLQRVPRPGQGIPELSDTSNAQLTWESFLQAPNRGVTLIAPDHIGISRLIKQVVLYTHAEQAHAEVRRYAVGSRAELRLRSGNTTARVTVDWQFRHEGEPSGVGFDNDVDALVLILELPQNLSETIDWHDPQRQRAARAARYNWEARENAGFRDAVPNPFLRGWIAQVFQIAALQVSIAHKIELRQALDLVADGTHLDVLLGVLQTVFQVPEVDNGEEGSDRLRQKLNEALNSEHVRKAVHAASRVLVEPIDSEWNGWLALSMRATIGAACLDAIQQACPQIDPDGLVVDIVVKRDDGGEPSAPELWISEVNPGGNGLIESVAELLTSRPDSLYRHIEAALGPRDFEWTNAQLRQIVQWLGGPQPDNEVIQAVTNVRQAANSADTAQHFSALRALLVNRGQSIFHGYSVALSMRLLRPDSPCELDRLLASIHARWDELENLHGVEVDVRVLCALFSVDDQLDQAFEYAGHHLPSDNRQAWRFGVLMGLLWPQGHALRAVSMPWSNRFSSFNIDTERLLLAQWLTPRPDPIDPAQSDWEEQVRERLLKSSRAVVSVPASQAGQLLPKVVAGLVSEPVQFEYLNVFAQLTEVKRLNDRIEWTFSIPDGI
jgi:hypothetical protein